MSNHDSRFGGHLWDELISLLDITLIFNMASHPQTDGARVAVAMYHIAQHATLHSTAQHPCAL